MTKHLYDTHFHLDLQKDKPKAIETITKNEYYDNVKNTINDSLSDFEKRVLRRFVAGQSYTQIAEGLNSPVKSIDNAIQRIRKKTAKNIENLTPPLGIDFITRSISLISLPIIKSRSQPPTLKTLFSKIVSFIMFFIYAIIAL